VLRKAADVYGLTENNEVSLVFCDDAYIQDLNKKYRGKDQSTDVLSFALNEGEEPEIVDGPSQVLLGDIIVSLETAARQAEEYNHSLEREVAYDHMTEEDKTEMRIEEEHVLSLLGITRDADS